MHTVLNIRNKFMDLLSEKNFTIDKTGVKTVEIIGESFLVDEDKIFGTVNWDYVQRELEWYLSQSLSVYDIPNTPKIWTQICDKDGMINSNYGWCIFSKENGEQYKHCLEQLKESYDSRRAMMIYTRPSMQTDYNKNGMSDFMCTNSVQCLIRNHTLYYIINQRSCDAIFGWKNDIQWHKWVCNKLLTDLHLTNSKIIHQVGSLHIYERHFYLIDPINYSKPSC